MAIFPGGLGLAGTRMSPFWIVLELRMMEVVVTTAAMQSSSQIVTTNKLTPNFFTGRMPFLSPNQQCQSTEWKYYTNSVEDNSLYPYFTRHSVLVSHAVFTQFANLQQWHDSRLLTAPTAAWKRCRLCHWLVAKRSTDTLHALNQRHKLPILFASQHPHISERLKEILLKQGKTNRQNIHIRLTEKVIFKPEVKEIKKQSRMQNAYQSAVRIRNGWWTDMMQMR